MAPPGDNAAAAAAAAQDVGPPWIEPEGAGLKPWLWPNPSVPGVDDGVGFDGSPRL